MEEKTTTSKQYSLDWRDLGKGLLVAVVTTVLLAIQTAMDAGVHLNWKQIGGAALTTAVAYLLKNFFTPSTTQTKA